MRAPHLPARVHPPTARARNRVGPSSTHPAAATAATQAADVGRELVGVIAALTDRWRAQAAAPAPADLIPAGCRGGVPDLVPLRALAECAELAEAVSRLTDGERARLAAITPPGPLARDIARTLVEAGFALHRCSTWDPLHRLGGVCLLPVRTWPGRGGPGGVVVSWTAHDLLSLDQDRAGIHHATSGIMNGALAGVMSALGYEVLPFGLGGAWIVTGRHETGGR